MRGSRGPCWAPEATENMELFPGWRTAYLRCREGRWIPDVSLFVLQSSPALPLGSKGRGAAGLEFPEKQLGKAGR